MAAGKGRQYGNRLGFWIFRAILKSVGLWPAYFAMLFVTAYYMVFRASVRASMQPYVSRRFPRKGKVAGWFVKARLVYSFGQVLIEQTALGLLGTEKMKVTFPRRQSFLELAKKKKGLVMITTHVGPWQSAMIGSCQMNKPVHFHFDLSHNERGHFFELASQGDEFSFIPPDSFMGGMVEAAAVLEKGHCLAVMGDRSEVSSFLMGSTFFGDTAWLPMIPYRLAYSTNANVVALLANRKGPLEYEVDFECLNQDLDFEKMTRDEAVKTMLDSYTAYLESFLEKNPLMWYNFFELWKK